MPFPAPVAFVLWLFAEIAIIATDIAEVVGTAIGLNLLFGIPLELGVVITALDVFLILWLQRLGFRWIEAFIITLLGVIFVCFFLQIALADPDWGQVIRGFAPTVEIVKNPAMLYLALGIIGATVMPHNLYLHSGIVQTRDYGHTLPEKREALRFATWDSTVALMFALLVNASILILAAATFYKAGPHDSGGDRGGPFDAGAAGGLHAGAQALRHRALVLRPQLDGDGHHGGPDRDGGLPRHPACPPGCAASSPASSPSCRPPLVTLYYGAEGTGTLLILSQVILAFQLPFAIVPLVMFTRDRAKMGALVSPSLAHGCGGDHRRHHHLPQRQAAVGHRFRLKSPKPGFRAPSWQPNLNPPKPRANGQAGKRGLWVRRPRGRQPACNLHGGRTIPCKQSRKNIQ